MMRTKHILLLKSFGNASREILPKTSLLNNTLPPTSKSSIVSLPCSSPDRDSHTSSPLSKYSTNGAFVYCFPTDEPPFHASYKVCSESIGSTPAADFVTIRSKNR